MANVRLANSIIKVFNKYIYVKLCTSMTNILSLYIAAKSHFCRETTIENNQSKN